MNGNTTRVNGKAEEASRVGDDIARILALPYSPPGQIIAALKGLQSDPDRLAAVLGGFSTAGSASDRLTGFRDAGGALLHAELGRRSVGAISGLTSAVEKLDRSTTRLTVAAIIVSIVGVLVTAAQLWIAPGGGRP